MADLRNGLGCNTWKRGLVAKKNSMGPSSSEANEAVILRENDIPGSSLAGRNPSSLKKNNKYAF